MQLLQRVALMVVVLVAGALPAAGRADAPAPDAPAPDATPTASADPYRWLEAVASPRATAWVAAENRKTLGALESDPRYAPSYAAALAIAQAKDRIPMPELLAHRTYNFWQDAAHVRGEWRSTADYRSAEPTWATTLDLDALAASEHANWVWEGADCREPDETRCLVQLSDGGEDAQTIREFDLPSKRFVSGGFSLPRGKQNAAWAGPDALLVAREWTPGELTRSGYPYVVKRLERGAPLTSATELFRGERTDVSVSPATFDDGTGHRSLLIVRSPTFFTFETYLVTRDGTARLALPLKSQVSGLVAGRLIVTLQEAWTVGGATYPAGAVVALDLARAQADPAHLAPTLVFAPGPRESLGEIAPTRSRLLLTAYENVRGRAYAYDPASNGGWTRRPIALPDDSSIDVAATSIDGDRAYLSVRGYLAPTALWSYDAASGELAVAKRLPPRFDASGDVVEQHEAASKDGTRVPYFIVHPKAMPLDGSMPTILYAYGGFDVSLTPTYSPNVGKLWLEHGGVYVVANIRGGGEFGPAWHDAALTVNRQRAFDDFAAVGEDLVARKITSPRRLGIQGGSNGGLLMGVEFVQHPELWHAVDIQVPLLDMLRFEQIAAGSSWVGEYGSVAVPAQRAFLASISPYANLRAGVTYPEPFIWTTTKDDRVGPQHARKFAARLSALGDPYLFYEVTEGGHGAGANLAERARTAALEFVYFARKLMAGGRAPDV